MTSIDGGGPRRLLSKREREEAIRVEARVLEEARMRQEAVAHALARAQQQPLHTVVMHEAQQESVERILRVQQTETVQDLSSSASASSSSSSSASSSRLVFTLRLEELVDQMRLLGFKESDVVSVIRTKHAEVPEQEISGLTASRLLDWLCLDLPESSLPLDFRSARQLSQQQQVSLYTASLDDFAGDLRRRRKVQQLRAWGFESEDSEKALSEVVGECVYAAAAYILRREMPHCYPVEAVEITLSSEEMEEVISSEQMALEAIYAEDFACETLSDGAFLWRLNVDCDLSSLRPQSNTTAQHSESRQKHPNTSRSHTQKQKPAQKSRQHTERNPQRRDHQRKSGGPSLDPDSTEPSPILLVYFPREHQYPCTLPCFLFVGAFELSGAEKMEVNRRLCTLAASVAPEPMIMELYTFLQSSVVDVVVERRKEHQRLRPHKPTFVQTIPEAEQRKASKVDIAALCENLTHVVDVQSLTYLEDMSSHWAYSDLPLSSTSMAQITGNDEENENDTTATVGGSESQTDVSLLHDGEQTDAGKEAERAAANAEHSDADAETVIPPLEELRETSLDRELLRNYRNKQRTKAYRDMFQRRAKLPCFLKKQEILSATLSSQVTVVSAETGAGKTTQVGQFLLEHAIENLCGSQCNIVVTQPRRISAVSVAERVAAERAERIGETVGYKIRLEAKSSRQTKLLFCTTGILLRRLQTDPVLEDVSHVIVDEIHERDINSDFLLIILKALLPKRPKLKLILMSATLNSALFSQYFGSCPVIQVPGRTFAVKAFFLEDAIEHCQYQMQPNSKYARRVSASFELGSRAGSSSDTQQCTERDRELGPTANSSSAGSQRKRKKASGAGRDVQRDEKLFYRLQADLIDYAESTRTAMFLTKEDEINFDLIEALVYHIHTTCDEGAILIFLPGLQSIRNLFSMLEKPSNSNPAFARLARQLRVVPLHSSLSSEDQKLVFQQFPCKRKVVLSTNIAETSVTIDDVVYVIDSCRMKQTRFDAKNSLSVLAETWVSQANCKQRRGRAGRVRPGICYHLVSRDRFQNHLEAFEIPEIHRSSLDAVALQIRRLDLGRIDEFLGRALDPPSAEAIQNSVTTLHALRALDSTSTQQLTPLGRDNFFSIFSIILKSAFSLSLSLGYHLAALPVDARIGKMLLFASIFGCLDPILTISASMSCRSPFVSPFDKRDEADAAKRKFAVQMSDHLTLLKAYDGYVQCGSMRARRAFCTQHFLSMNTLSMIGQLRNQFRELLVSIGFATKQSRTCTQAQAQAQGRQAGAPENRNSGSWSLISSVIFAGLYPNLLRVDVVDRHQNGKPKKCEFVGRDGNKVEIHPCSVNFNRADFGDEIGSAWLTYLELVKTSKAYVRDCTPVSAYACLFFGGEIEVFHKQNCVTVDNFVGLKISPKTAVLIKELRKELDDLLQRKIETPDIDLPTSGKAVIDACCGLLK